MATWGNWALCAVFLAASTLSALAQDKAPERQVYQLPKGASPHDVAPAPDGKVWYSAQQIGALGIVDPQSGQARHVPLGHGSAPHGVIQGPDGAAWLTDGGQNAIVRVDPATEEIKSWPLPRDSANANLNTAVFDRDGMLWFTGQNGIYGRLDPRTGAVKVWKAPRGRGPYGITATPQGGIYYASLAGNHIARIDRATGEASVIAPPTPSQGARRVWSDSQGRIWVSEWNAGQLGLYDPKSQQWRAGEAPRRHPHACAPGVEGRAIRWGAAWG